MAGDFFKIVRKLRTSIIGLAAAFWIVMRWVTMWGLHSNLYALKMQTEILRTKLFYVTNLPAQQDKPVVLTSAFFYRNAPVRCTGTF